MSLRSRRCVRSVGLRRAATLCSRCWTCARCRSPAPCHSLPTVFALPLSPDPSTLIAAGQPLASSLRSSSGLRLYYCSVKRLVSSPSKGTIRRNKANFDRAAADRGADAKLEGLYRNVKECVNKIDRLTDGEVSDADRGNSRQTFVQAFGKELFQLGNPVAHPVAERLEQHRRQARVEALRWYLGLHDRWSVEAELGRPPVYGAVRERFAEHEAERAARRRRR